MLVYIDSPFQLLQCKELLSSVRGKFYTRLNGHQVNDQQLISLIGLLEIDSTVVKLDKSYKKIAFYIYFFLLVLFEKEVVIGDANSIIFKLIRHFNTNKKFILLDDGVATLNNLSENSKYRRFTIFSESVKYPIVNKFSLVSEMVKVDNAREVNIIVGAKFVDEGICSVQSYIEAIAKIYKKLEENGRQIIYVAHRGESDIMLEKLSEKFCFKILRLKYPIELIALELKIEPIYVAHVLSTAVFSFRLIYPKSKIYTYQMPHSELLSRNSAIERLYDILESQKWLKKIN